MKWVNDDRHGFVKRPFYDQIELDRICQDEVFGFLKKHRGTVSLPILTGDLTVLIESRVKDLDPYADLSEEGPDVEGVTIFVPGSAPIVKISNRIPSDPGRDNRFRTTLSHELGHVLLHALGQRSVGQMQIEDGQQKTQRCQRGGILTRSKVDWMEWQAGYASGALLMPVSPLSSVAREMLAKRATNTVPSVGSGAARDAIRVVAERFMVSQDAAKVRLLQLGLITEGPPQSLLFG